VVGPRANKDPYLYLKEAHYGGEEMVQARAQFVIYPGVAHTITYEMFEDVKKFFASHKPVDVKPAQGGLLPAIKLLLDE